MKHRLGFYTIRHLTSLKGVQLTLEAREPKRRIAVRAELREVNGVQDIAMIPLFMTGFAN